MFKIEELMKTGNEEVAKIPEDKDLNLTKIHHPIYATQVIVTYERKGTGRFNFKTRSQKQSVG
jgi:hypothetical protein